MPSTYSNLKIQLMSTGENNTTWGNVTNINLGTAMEEAITSTATVTFASANVSLTLTDTNATQSARRMRLRCTGTTGGSTRNLVVPTFEKVYIVQNDCADGVTVKTASGTGVTVPAGKSMWLYVDGTNVVDVVTHLSSLTSGSLALTTPLALSSGGVGSNTQSGARAVLGAAASGTNTDITSVNGLLYAVESATISATGATGTVNYDAVTQSVLYYNSNAIANWTINIRGNSGTSLNSLLSTGGTLTIAFLVQQGSTPYYNTSVQVDGTTSGVTTRWQGGTAPTAGNASGIDVYTYTVIKTGSATFTVLASQTRF